MLTRHMLLRGMPPRAWMEFPRSQAYLAGVRCTVLHCACTFVVVHKCVLPLSLPIKCLLWMWSPCPKTFVTHSAFVNVRKLSMSPSVKNMELLWVAPKPKHVIILKLSLTTQSMCVQILVILYIVHCYFPGPFASTKNGQNHFTFLCVVLFFSRTLRLNPEWTNPSGEWRVGIKRAYELFPKQLVTRVKTERRKEWDKKHLTAEVQYFIATILHFTGYSMGPPVRSTLLRNRDTVFSKLMKFTLRN